MILAYAKRSQLLGAQCQQKWLLLYLRRFLFFIPGANIKLCGTYLRCLYTKSCPRSWRRVLLCYYCHQPSPSLLRKCSMLYSRHHIILTISQGYFLKLYISLTLIFILIAIIATSLPPPYYQLYILRSITLYIELFKDLLYSLLSNITSKYL